MKRGKVSGKDSLFALRGTMSGAYFPRFESPSADLSNRMQILVTAAKEIEFLVLMFSTTSEGYKERLSSETESVKLLVKDESWEEREDVLDALSIIRRVVTNSNHVAN